MRAFPAPRLQRFRTHRHERGITLIFVVVAIFALLGIAALAIDLVTLYVSKAEAQRVADAAALAGAKALIDGGVTADPANNAVAWDTACDHAIVQAQGLANQGLIGGSAPATTDVCFSSGISACLNTCPTSGSAGSGFGVNPQVGVTVRSTTLPLFFAKIWGQRSATVSATSRAEGFNPSGTTVPVQANCVTPWLLPNIDPGASIAPPTAIPIINTTTGQILSPGPTGILNEDIQLDVACGANCNFGARIPPTWSALSVNRFVSYYPLNLGSAAISGPSCSAGGNYSKNITSCNRNSLQCGSTVTLAGIYPQNAGPNLAAIQCLSNAAASGPGAGQDTLDTTTFPFTIDAGSNNPLAVSGAVTAGDVISSSRSVVTLPIYDQTLYPGAPPPNTVKVIGFAQAFVEQVSATGQPTIRILNVSGCGPGLTGTAVGDDQASSVPVRLIHP